MVVLFALFLVFFSCEVLFFRVIIFSWKELIIDVKFWGGGRRREVGEEIDFLSFMDFGKI